MNASVLGEAPTVFLVAEPHFDEVARASVRWLLRRVGDRLPFRRCGDVHTNEGVLDTRQDEARARELKAFWLGFAANHAKSGSDGIFGYNLFSISKRDFGKVQELHVRYYREIQEIVARSKPNDVVALFAAQLFRLDRTD